MLVWDSASDAPKDLDGSAVTIGKFEALHLGHRQLLHELVELAEEQALAAVAITFDPHPNRYFRPDEQYLPLLGPTQRKLLFEESGLDALLTLNFDRALAELSAEAFVEHYLVDALNCRLLLVGPGFRFGSGGDGDVTLLRSLGDRHGFSVRELRPVAVAGRQVSSTAVRASLDVGDVEGANSMLGRRHETAAMVEHGLKIGRKIGFPTANLSRNYEGYLPLDGVYAGWLHCSGQRYPAAVSIGVNATFQEVPRLLEAHVPYRNDLDFYDQLATVEYVAFIRPSKTFDSAETLIAAINADVAKVMEVLDNS